MFLAYALNCLIAVNRMTRNCLQQAWDMLSNRSKKIQPNNPDVCEGARDFVRN
jgi:hypothetical protein